jgi:regulator of sirC expression with transglutaminase-like and TPR domain
MLRELLLDPAPHIERVALAIAADEYPSLRPYDHLRQLDALAYRLLGRLRGAESPAQLIERLVHFFYVEAGFQGNQDDFYDPRNSYLNDVLQRRLGIPISLAVVLMALGRRIGVPIAGIGFPGHFLVRIGGSAGPLLDPYNQGVILSHLDLQRLAARAVDGGAGVTPQLLEPVGPRAMALRMLANLQHAYERRGDHARAMVVCDRLLDLSSAPVHHRDRGLHAHALGAYRIAASDLERYLAEEPDAPDAPQVMRLLLKAVAAQQHLPN